MRILISSLNSCPWLSEPLSRRDGIEIAALHAAFVDLGDFGVSQPAPETQLPYLLHTARVFPVRPYPYSLYLNGVAPVLREFRPQVIYHIGEPSELSTAQITRLAQRVTMPRLHTIAACTNTAKALLVREGFDESHIRVVYSGADPVCFRRRDASDLRHALRADDLFLIGYVGRLVHEKAVDVLMEALARLPQRVSGLTRPYARRRQGLAPHPVTARSAQGSISPSPRG